MRWNESRRAVGCHLASWKDLQTSHEVGNVDAFLDGELDDFIEAYLLAAAGGTLKKGGVTDEADA